MVAVSLSLGQLSRPVRCITSRRARIILRLGRFLQPDPSGYAGGLNLYAYAGDDPVNEVDSTGLCSQMQDSNGNPLTPWSCRNDNCGLLDCTPEPPPNALANLFYSLGPPEFTQQIPCLAGVGCYVPPGGTVPPEAASPQENPGQEDQLQCAKGKLARLASGLIQDGTAVTFAGTVVTAGGGALTASGALASALGQPELGVPTMASGEFIASGGATMTYIGIGMQVGGGALKWYAGGGPRAALAGALHGLAAAGNAIVGQVLPGLPDVLPFDPLDAAADALERRLGESTCH